MTDLLIPHSIVLLAAATALLFAAAHDVAVRTVPNGVSIIVAAAGLTLNALDGLLISALFSGAMIFAGSWYCWRRGWIGGGDVKLLTASSMLVPPASLPTLILSTTLIGGVMAVIYIALARVLPAGTTPRPANLPGRVWRAECRRIRGGRSLPYCCAIAAGALLTLFSPVRFG